MLKAPTEFIILFIIISVILILFLATFIIMIIYRYQQKQNIYFKELEALKVSHQNTLLQSQLEIQEQTFQNLSREIHDNIGQKLTLAKLYLNTLNYNTPKVAEQVENSVSIISEAISDLSDLSHSLSNEIVLNNGLITALQFELSQLDRSGIYKIEFCTTGDTFFMDANKELVIFRIAQEAINNIVKHAKATTISISMHYGSTFLTMEISDNGIGFNEQLTKPATGLYNIKNRTSILKGNFSIISKPDAGTLIKIEIPFYANNTTI